MADETNTQAGTGAPSDPQPQQGNPTPNQPVPGETGNNVNNPEAKKYADEAAAERKARRALEAELQKIKDSQLSEREKLERDYAATQAKSLEYEAEMNRMRLELSAFRQSSKLGVGEGNMPLVLAYIHQNHLHELQTGDDGYPSNLGDLVKQVLKDYPALGVQPQPPRPAASSGGATNPGSAARTGVITKSMLRSMSPQERVARNKEVMEALSRNGGTLPD